MKSLYLCSILLLLLLSSCCKQFKTLVYHIKPSAHEVNIVDRFSKDTVYKGAVTDSLKIVYRKCDCKRLVDEQVIPLKRNKAYYILLRRSFFDEKKVLIRPKRPVVDTLYFE